MKISIAVFTAFTLIFSCAKTNNQPLIKGKLVYRSCATTVVEVLDAKFFSLGQDSWQDQSKQNYQHVFAVANDCTLPPSLNLGQEFYFKILNNDPKASDCVECALYDNPPVKTQLIKVTEAED